MEKQSIGQGLENYYYYYYCIDVENCESFKNFGFIYIYIDNNNNNNNNNNSNKTIVICKIWL